MAEIDARCVQKNGGKLGEHQQSGRIMIGALGLSLLQISIYVDRVLRTITTHPAMESSSTEPVYPVMGSLVTWITIHEPRPLPVTIRTGHPPQRSPPAPRPDLSHKETLMMEVRPSSQCFFGGSQTFRQGIQPTSAHCSPCGEGWPLQGGSPGP